MNFSYRSISCETKNFLIKLVYLNFLSASFNIVPQKFLCSCNYLKNGDPFIVFGIIFFFYSYLNFLSASFNIVPQKFLYSCNYLKNGDPFIVFGIIFFFYSYLNFHLLISFPKISFPNSCTRVII